jgi:hypothetical protein
MLQYGQRVPVWPNPPVCPKALAALELVKTLDSTLEIMPSSLDDSSPLERIFHMFAERNVSNNKGTRRVLKTSGRAHR